MKTWRQWIERKKLGFTGGALVLVLVAAIRWQSSSQGAIQLADGSRLTFDEVSVGTNCSRFYGSALSRLAQSLPVELGRYFPQGATFPRAWFETNVVFWLQRDRSSLPQDRVRFSLVDPQGRVVLLRLPVSEQILPDGRVAVSVASAVWPRDAAKFILQVHDASLATSNQLAGRWEIRNPLPVARATWTPEPLPVARPVGDALVTLEYFETRPMPVMRSLMARTNEVESLGFLEFQWTNSNQNSPPGVLADLRLHDAVGNVTPWLPVRQTPNQRIHVAPVKLPWPGERSYQIETRWGSSQPEAADIRGQIQVVLKTPPAAGEKSRAVGNGQFAGTDVVIQARAQEGGSASGCRLSAEVMRRNLVDRPNYLVSLVDASDEVGHRWLVDGRGEIQLPAGVDSATVTAVLRPLVTLRFTAEPIRRTNSLPQRRTGTR